MARHDKLSQSPDIKRTTSKGVSLFENKGLIEQLRKETEAKFRNQDKIVRKTLEASKKEYGFDPQLARFLVFPVIKLDKEELKINKMDMQKLKLYYENLINNFKINNQTQRRLLSTTPTKDIAYSLYVLKKHAKLLGDNRIALILKHDEKEIVDIVSYLTGDFVKLFNTPEESRELSIIQFDLQRSNPVKTPKKIQKIHSRLEMIEKDIIITKIIRKANPRSNVLCNFDVKADIKNGYTAIKFWSYKTLTRERSGLSNGYIQKGYTSYIVIDTRNFNKNAVEEYICTQIKDPYSNIFNGQSSMCRPFILLFEDESSHAYEFNGLNTNIAYLSKDYNKSKLNDIVRSLSKANKSQLS